MNRHVQILTVVVAAVIIGFFTMAQTFRPQRMMPGENVINQARELTSQVFSDLKNGNSEKIAKWIVEQVGYTWDASQKVQQTSDFKSKLDVILLDPPAGPYGKIDGYDLIDESYLPGSNRYFRLSYISYHQGAPLVWEFRFYVKPNSEVALNHISWTEDNPFQYLSTNEMLLPIWDKGN